MIDINKRTEKELSKQKTRQRMNVQVDLENYEYFPAEKEPDFYSTDITQYVGIYVRVSTGDVKQTTSFELQKKYYEEYVSKHSNWHLVKIYADEGISGKRKSKSTTCKILFAKLVALMDWNPEYRYKMIGRIIHANGEYLIAFDLNATEVYKKTIDPNNKPKKSRTPVYPADWQNQFGIPFYEHKKSMQINIFDGYAIYSVKEQVDSETPQEEPNGSTNNNSINNN